jgi:hypothetical protein
MIKKARPPRPGVMTEAQSKAAGIMSVAERAQTYGTRTSYELEDAFRVLLRPTSAPDPSMPIKTVSVKRRDFAVLADISRLAAVMEGVAQDAGYNLAFYGSTVRNGEGRDIDVMAVSWREYPSRDLLLEYFEQRGYAKASSWAVSAVLNKHTILLREVSTGLILDLVVIDCEVRKW